MFIQMGKKWQPGRLWWKAGKAMEIWSPRGLEALASAQGSGGPFTERSWKALLWGGSRKGFKGCARFFGRPARSLRDIYGCKGLEPLEAVEGLGQRC